MQRQPSATSGGHSVREAAIGSGGGAEGGGVGTGVGDGVGLGVGVGVGAGVGVAVGVGAGVGLALGVGVGVGAGVGVGLGVGVGRGVALGVGFGVAVGRGVAAAVGRGDALAAGASDVPEGAGMGDGVGLGVGLGMVGSGVGRPAVCLGVGVGPAAARGVGSIEMQPPTNTATNSDTSVVGARIALHRTGRPTRRCGQGSQGPVVPGPPVNDCSILIVHRSSASLHRLSTQQSTAPVPVDAAAPRCSGYVGDRNATSCGQTLDIPLPEDHNRASGPLGRQASRVASGPSRGGPEGYGEMGREIHEAGGRHQIHRTGR
jgi:hypothetical protein